MSDKENKAFPREYEEKDIEKEVDRLVEDIKISHPQAGNYYSKASLGLTELQRRYTRNIGVWSLTLSFLAVILSGFAVYFAFKATKISDAWQQEQLEALEEIRCLLDDSSAISSSCL